MKAFGLSPYTSLLASTSFLEAAASASISHVCQQWQGTIVWGFFWEYICFVEISNVLCQSRLPLRPWQ